MGDALCAALDSSSTADERSPALDGNGTRPSAPMGLSSPRTRNEFISSFLSGSSESRFVGREWTDWTCMHATDTVL